MQHKSHNNLLGFAKPGGCENEVVLHKRKLSNNSLSAVANFGLNKMSSSNSKQNLFFDNASDGDSSSENSSSISISGYGGNSDYSGGAGPRFSSSYANYHNHHEELKVAPNLLNSEVVGRKPPKHAKTSS